VRSEVHGALHEEASVADQFSVLESPRVIEPGAATKAIAG
jgi:hypothetical protein